MLKSFPKILTIFFLLIFIFQLGCFILLLTLPESTKAADNRAWIVGDVEFKPQVDIPGLNKEFTAGKNGGYAMTNDTSGIAKYIRVVYNYAIGIIGILAAVVLMVGGVLWIVAGGNTTQIGEAKAWIGASLTGLILALTSYLILYTVNPDLVNLQITDIKSVSEMKIGCCIIQDAESKPAYENTDEITCTSEGKNGTWTQGKCVIRCCITHAMPTDLYENTTQGACYAKRPLDVTFADKPCPTPCCVYGSRTGGWAGCAAKIGLTSNDCSKLGTPSALKYSDGHCITNDRGGSDCESNIK